MFTFERVTLMTNGRALSFMALGHLLLKKINRALEQLVLVG